MRILFTSHYGLPHLGGIETVIDALARELAGRGHEVTHLASDARRRDEAVVTAAGSPPYRVLRVGALNLFEERLGVPYPLFSPRLVGILRRELARADVAHAHGFLYEPTPLALGMARRAGTVAGVLTEHVGRVGYSRRALGAAERAAVATVGRASARLARASVALNSRVAAELKRLAPATPVVRIANGVDLDAYRPPEPGERERLRSELGWDERPRALFVGRLVDKKGAGLAIAAADRAGIGLTLVGPGQAPARLPDRVAAIGPQPPERVRELYRAADVFLLPSRGEGFPVTAQEALASGLPVVLGDDPAYRDQVGGDGAVLAGFAPEALAAALRDLIARGPPARDAARRHAVASYSWSRAADEHERLYESVAAGR